MSADAAIAYETELAKLTAVVRELAAVGWRLGEAAGGDAADAAHDGFLFMALEDQAARLLEGLRAYIDPLAGRPPKGPEPEPERPASLVPLRRAPATREPGRSGKPDPDAS